FISENVNQCCVYHDKCYDDQHGRKYCDDTFCSCLEQVTRGYKVCHDENSVLFCSMVRQFGAHAYLRAGNHTGAVLVEETEVDLSHIGNSTNFDKDDVAVLDFDYETLVRANDTNGKPIREGTDLLEVLVKTAK
ncbi:unnamed protein product, partial [Cylicostephanus goldi]